MSRFVRASKVRNIFADKTKEDQTWRGYKFKQPGAVDTQGIKCNDQYLAISVATGSGSLAITDINGAKRMDRQPPVLFHRGQVIDFDFNPFFNNLIASGDDLGSVFVWGIPNEGLTENISDPLIELEGVHDKSVNNILFHPTASHVLATASTDCGTKLFDVEHEKEVWSFSHPEPVFHLAWNDEGSVLATTCKDKKLRLLDPRTSETTAEKAVHPGPKTIKSVFMDNHGAGKGNLATLGFSVQSKRQIKIWDYRKVTTELVKVDIDNTNSVFMPFYDPSLNLLYLQGRGERKARVFEVVDDKPWQFEVFNETINSPFNEPTRGACMLPKRCVNVMRDGNHGNKGPEVGRMYLASQKGVVPITWVIPRKNTKFWPELFENEVYAGKMSLTAEEFFAGKKSTKPKMMSLDPKKQKGGAVKKSPGLGGAIGGGGGDEVSKLKAEVARLKGLLDKNNIKY